MASDPEYVFLTSHGTVLFQHDGSLVHGNFASFVPNLTCMRRGDGFALADGGQDFGATVERLPREGEFGLRSPRGFLSAARNGFTRWKESVDGWETFTLMPLDEALQHKDRQTTINIPNFFRPYGRNKIPNVIHQTSHAREIEGLYLDNVNALRSRNPDWVYQYYSDEAIIDFIRREYGYEMLACYLRINPRYGAARADLFRYLCIYGCGGVYLDIKSNCTVPLNAIIRPDDEYLLSHWSNAAGEQHAGFGLHGDLQHIPGGEYQQWHVIACARHPFLENVIKSLLTKLGSYDERTAGVGKAAVLRLTGPILYTLAIHPLLDAHPHRFFNSRAEGMIYCATAPYSNALRHYGLQRTPVVL